MKKRTIAIAVSATIAAVGLAAALLLYYFSQRVSYEGLVPGDVHSEVTIRRDSGGTPVIEADSREDLFFALGFVHTQDRFILMEYYRMIAMSRTAEYAGPDGIILDRMTRTAGIRSRASEITENLGEPYRAYLQAYTKGINSVRKKWIKVFPLKREWQPVDVIAIMLLREWASSFLNNTEIFFQFEESERKLNPESFFPQNMISYYPPEHSTGASYLTSMKDVLNKYLGIFNNGFAFPVKLSSEESVKHAAAVSFESSTSIYPDWYPVVFQYGDIKLTGITVAGLPFFFSGSNQSMAFCSFNLKTDTQRFYAETVSAAENTMRYKHRGVWKDFKTVREPDLSEPQVSRFDIVWLTGNGPVINDIFTETGSEKTIYTMSCIHPNEKYFKTLFDIPFSENARKALNSVQPGSSPSAYLFIDQNDTFIKYSGRLFPGPQSKSVFLEGATAAAEQVVVNNTIIPGQLSGIAGTGFIETAPYIIRSQSIHDSSRLKRLEELVRLATRRGADADENEILEILTDTYSVNAFKLAPLFAKMLAPAPITSARLARIYFSEWDYRFTKDQVAPTIFEGLTRNYIIETVKDEFPSQKETLYQNYSCIVDRFSDIILAGKEKEFFDDRRTEKAETPEMIFDRAFLVTTRELNRLHGPVMNDWTWGKTHKSRYGMPFENVSLFSRYYHNPDTIPFEGASSTVFTGKSDGSFRPVRATSLCGVISTENSILNAGFSFSVNPFSEFYFEEKKPGGKDKFGSDTVSYTTTIVPTEQFEPK